MFLIRAYRLAISPFLASTCRFYPNCSSYAEESLRTHGVCKGLYLIVRRILRCHPWHEGGIDLVPEKHSAACVRDGRDAPRCTSN